MTIGLVKENLKELIEQGNIKSNYELKEYLQPNSIDLPIEGTAYLVANKFSTYNQKVEELLKTYAVEKISLKEKPILYKGQTYIIPTATIDLPSKYKCSVSPKSSIGRVDLVVRTIHDESGIYDKPETGKKVKLWLEVTPNSFNVKIEEGMSLNQLRCLEKGKKAPQPKEQVLFNEDGEPIERKWDEEELVMGLEINPKTPGFKSKDTNKVIDMTKRKANNPKDFFKKIRPEGKSLTLEKDKFYILNTKEIIHIPPEYQVEMKPYDDRALDARVHYAGFFDSGFTAQAVLELRSNEVKNIVDGQPICFMKFYKNTKKPKELYGENSNYQGQKGPKLAKYFKDWN